MLGTRRFDYPSQAKETKGCAGGSRPIWRVALSIHANGRARNPYRYDATIAAVDRTQGLADPPSKSAAREAFEEAGVRGKIGARPIGHFRYRKPPNGAGAEVDCEVKVFPLLVKRQSATWPEFGQRVAQWVDPEKAISLIKEPELKSIVAIFAKRAAAAASKLIY